MAAIRKRKLKTKTVWVVSYRDHLGVQKAPYFDTKKEAEAFFSKVASIRSRRKHLKVDPNITLETYSSGWLEKLQLTEKVRPQSISRYKGIITNHLVPKFGQRKLADLGAPEIEAFLLDKRKTSEQHKELKMGTVQLIFAVTNLLFKSATRDGLFQANPLAGLSSELGLAKKPRKEKIKAFEQEQLDTFLSEAASSESAYFPVLCTLAWTGMRLSEALALQWKDLDLQGHQIQVDKTLTNDGRVDQPKTDSGIRTVDMASSLQEVLSQLLAQRRKDLLAQGQGEVPLDGWVFSPGLPDLSKPNKAACDNARRKVQRAFHRVVKKANLPTHFYPHCLRHTFASLLLVQGESPVYVQRQLGHSSIRVTVDRYGRWLPMGNKAAVDKLAGEAGSRLVADWSCTPLTVRKYKPIYPKSSKRMFSGSTPRLSSMSKQAFNISGGPQM